MSNPRIGTTDPTGMARMREHVAAAGEAPGHKRAKGSGNGRLALVLLILVGGLLAVSVLLSKIAYGHGMPMLTYLAFAMGGSGAILLLRTRRRERVVAPRQWVWGYSAIAGGLMALGSAIGYLTIHVVGASFISLAIAFPPLLTWALSLLLGVERFNLTRGLGLLIALCGGILLAIGKGLDAPQAVAGHVMAACAIPLVLAIGNVFRTRYWPPGVDPRRLAALMLLCGGALTIPVALGLEGPLALVSGDRNSKRHFSSLPQGATGGAAVSTIPAGESKAVEGGRPGTER